MFQIISLIAHSYMSLSSKGVGVIVTPNGVVICSYAANVVLIVITNV